MWNDEASAKEKKVLQLEQDAKPEGRSEYQRLGVGFHFMLFFFLFEKFQNVYRKHNSNVCVSFIEVVSLCFHLTSLRLLIFCSAEFASFNYGTLSALYQDGEKEEKKQSQRRDLLIKDLVLDGGLEVESKPRSAFNETGNTSSLRLSLVPSLSPLFSLQGLSLGSFEGRGLGLGRMAMP